MLNDIYQGLDPIAFSLGPLVVRWYGLAYVLGFVCAAAIIYFVAKRWKLGMSEDNLLTLMVCANFVNGELWGAPTDGPLGVVFGGAAGMMPRHPSQLYEAVLEGIVIFCVLFALSRKRPPRPQGTFLGAFLVLYGIFRFLIEFVREPDVQLGYLWGGWLTMGQVLSAPLIVAGIALLIYAARTRHPQAGPQEIQPPSVPGDAA